MVSPIACFPHYSRICGYSFPISGFILFPHHWFCQASLNIFNLCPFSWLHIFLHLLKCLFLLLYLLFSLLLLVRNISQYLRDLELYCLYLAGKENLKTSRPRDEVTQSQTWLKWLTSSSSSRPSPCKQRVSKMYWTQCYISLNILKGIVLLWLDLVRTSLQRHCFSEVMV